LSSGQLIVEVRTRSIARRRGLAHDASFRARLQLDRGWNAAEIGSSTPSADCRISPPAI